jgi:hypothetical protein
MANPANQEFFANSASSAGHIVANGATPAFKIKTGDEIRGGFEPLLGTIAVVGDLDGGTATLQILVGGVWHSTSFVLNGSTTAIMFGTETAPRASAFRFLVAGGGGSLAASFYVAARSPMVFV